MKILRTASLGTNFTDSYIKKSVCLFLNVYLILWIIDECSKFFPSMIGKPNCNCSISFSFHFYLFFLFLSSFCASSFPYYNQLHLFFYKQLGIGVEKWNSSYELRVTSSNLRVSGSNPRVARLKHELWDQKHELRD